MSILAKKDTAIFSIIGYLYIGFLALFCLFPFLLVISGSITRDSTIFQYGYRLIPKDISFEAYRIAFEVPQVILRAYMVTIGITAVGTTLSLFFSSMTAYVLHKKDFKYRNKFSLYFYFTTLFQGGLVPWYILMVKYLGMKNSYWALIFPHLFSVFHIIILRTFMSSIPDSLGESAKLDGASEFRVFLQIMLPLSKPALATIGLFTALSYWDEWFNTMLFIDNKKKYTLQYFLHLIISKIDFLKNVTDEMIAANMEVEMPSESFKLAMTVITTGPIIFLYPYLQKYFVKGIMIGAVKG